MKDIRTKPFYYSDEASAVLAETWIDTIDIKNTLTHGDIDFSVSNVKEGAAKVYVIEGKTVNQVPITLEVLNFEKKAVLKSIKK